MKNINTFVTLLNKEIRPLLKENCPDNTVHLDIFRDSGLINFEFTGRYGQCWSVGYDPHLCAHDFVQAYFNDARDFAADRCVEAWINTMPDCFLEHFTSDMEDALYEDAGNIVAILGNLFVLLATMYREGKMEVFDAVG